MQAPANGMIPVQSKDGLRWRTKVGFATCCIVAVVAGAAESADDPAVDHADDVVQRWFDVAWNESQRIRPMNEYQIAWTVTDYTPLLNAGSSGTGLPPGASVTPSATKPAENVLHYVFTAGDHEAWRCNVTYPSLAFVDTVSHPERSWQLSRNQLKVFDPTLRNDPASEQGVNTHLRSFFLDLTQITDGGFGIGRVAEVKPGRLRRSGERWTCRAERHVSGKVTYAVEFTGEWNTDTRRGRVLSMTTILNQYAPSDVGSVVRMSEWRWSEPLRLECAGVVEKRRSDGRLERRMVLHDVAPLPPGGFEAITRVPMDGHDPMRSEIVLKQIVNYHRGEVVDPSTGNVEPLRTALSSASPRPGSDRLRFWGYFALCSATALLAALKFRQWRARQHKKV